MKKPRLFCPSKEWKEGRFKESWWRGDTISVGIGQGYWTATPLQIANAMNILVNRGINHPPHLVQVVKKDDEVTQINNEEKPPIFLKEPHHWQIALDAMHNTVQKASGTAHKAFKGTNYDSAGKTGTAQIVSIAQGERYDAKSLKERQRDNTIYVGFAPYEDPRIVVSVVLENNHGGVQIARQLMDYYFAANPVNLARNNTP
jgi:penicillin-binding protein 2